MAASTASLLSLARLCIRPPAMSTMSSQISTINHLFNTKLVAPKTCSRAFRTNNRTTGCTKTLSALFSQARRTFATSQPQLESSITSSTTTKSPITAASTTSSLPNLSQQKLPWNRFLHLRRTRRIMSLSASITCGLISISTAAWYIGTNPNFDTKISSLVGLDPMFTLVGFGVACGAVGWLMGPFIGSSIFNRVYRDLRPFITAKEKEFLIRIRKYRVDPTTSSLGNPVPDYYGEKIGSVRDYRRWLKDQRAFNLKRAKDLV